MTAGKDGDTPATSPAGDAADGPPGDPLPFHSFAPGEIAAGRYRILRLIGRGGMGEVFEAEDLELGGTLALKTLRPELAMTERELRRFKREIQLARRVTHPNVCRTFDLAWHELGPAGRTGDSTGRVAFLTMELLEGESLAQRLASRGPLDTAEAFEIVRQAAAGIAAAHEAGVTHRDLKPGNIMLVAGSQGERVVVADFGLALGERGGESVARPGQVVGTPAYVAPEQVDGREVTAAADVYALGVVMYEMVTGELPFAGSGLGAAVERVKSDPPSPSTRRPGLDPNWEAVILRCLSRSPADRFTSVADVPMALSGSLPVRPRRPRRVLAAAVLALVAAGLAAALAAGFANGWWRPSAPPSPGVSGLRTSVAMLGFRNLSGDEEDSWLSGAVSEMLVTELAAGEQLRVVPAESVTRAKLELAIPDAESLASDTLARLRAQLGVDIVAVGSCLSLTGAAGERFRVDVRLQDARTGATVATIQETHADLFTLITRLGARLRDRLGAGELSPAGRRAVLLARPASPAAARLLAEGLSALRLFDAPRAVELLGRAVEEDPRSAAAHSALSRAYTELLRHEEAARAADRAHELAGGLPREQRLTIEALHHEVHGRWARAAEIHSELWDYFPDELEYALALVNALHFSGDSDAARALIHRMRSESSLFADDPRLDLFEARLVLPIDAARGAELAGRAADRGAELGASLLVAHARLLQARALNWSYDTVGAVAAYEEAVELTRSTGARALVAPRLRELAMLLHGLGDPRAEGLLVEAVQMLRDTGWPTNLAMAVQSLAEIRYAEGNLEGARAAFQESLDILAAHGHSESQPAVPQVRLARTELRAGRLREARSWCERAQASLDGRESPSARRALHVCLAMIDREEGRPAEAASGLTAALEQARATGQSNTEAGVLIELGRAELDRGNVAVARRHLERAVELQRGSGFTWSQAFPQVTLARIALAEGDVAQAEELARTAAEALAKHRRLDEEIEARAVLTRSLRALGRSAESASELSRVRELAARSQDPRSPLHADLAGEDAAVMTRARDRARELGLVVIEREAEAMLSALHQPAPR